MRKDRYEWIVQTTEINDPKKQTLVSLLNSAVTSAVAFGDRRLPPDAVVSVRVVIEMRKKPLDISDETHNIEL